MLAYWDISDCWLIFTNHADYPRIHATRISHKSEQYLTNPRPRLLYQSWGLNAPTSCLQQFSCPLASHPVTLSIVWGIIMWASCRAGAQSGFCFIVRGITWVLQGAGAWSGHHFKGVQQMGKECHHWWGWGWTRLGSALVPSLSLATKCLSTIWIIF